MAKIVCFIQARLTSTRLPGKVALDLGGRTVVQRVVDAAMASRYIKETRVLWAEDFPHLDENNVLSRFYQASLAYSDLDGIVRLTGDCPLMDTQVIDLVVSRFFHPPVEYCSNVYPQRTFPDGLDVEVFTPELLEVAHDAALEEYDREHVTPWMRRWADTVSSVSLPINWSHVRLTLDTMEDYTWLQTAINAPRTG